MDNSETALDLRPLGQTPHIAQMPNPLARNLLLQIPNDAPMAHIGLVQPGLCVGYAPHESYTLDSMVGGTKMNGGKELDSCG